MSDNLDLDECGTCGKQQEFRGEHAVLRARPHAHRMLQPPRPMTTTIEQLEATLRAGLTKAKKRKAKIQAGDFGDGKKSCCAITSVYAWRPREKPPANLLRHCWQEVLGISEDEMWQIVWGFDGVFHEKSDDELHRLGQKLRKEFAP